MSGGIRPTERARRRVARVHEHLMTAATMYREMGMTFWLEKAEAASLEG
jgi:hypothetical protein